jgi:hypothetical protein
MTTETINASIVSARLTGHIHALINLADRDKDYKTCIMHLKVLISTYSGNEFSSACHQWIYDWKQELEKYEQLQLKRTTR